MRALSPRRTCPFGLTGEGTQRPARGQVCLFGEAARCWSFWLGQLSDGPVIAQARGKGVCGKGQLLAEPYIVWDLVDTDLISRLAARASAHP